MMPTKQTPVKLPLRERRLEKARRDLHRFIMRREHAISEIERLGKLIKIEERHIRRLEKPAKPRLTSTRVLIATGRPPEPYAEPRPKGSGGVEILAEYPVKPGDVFGGGNGGDDGLDVPGFLQRGQAAQKAVDDILDKEAKRLAALPDPRTKEKKAERRAVEKEVRERELTGKRRRMPPQGREALKQIQKG